MSESFFGRTIDWIARHNPINKIKNIFNTEKPNKTQQHHQEILVFPGLAYNPEQARAYSLSKIRKGLQKNKSNEQIGKQIQARIKKTQKYFSRNLNNEEKPLQLACPICIEFMVCPVSTSCGHAFCWQCIDEALLINSSCPVCRCQILGRELIRCLNLSAIISVFLNRLKNIDEQSHESSYNKRLKVFDHWVAQRKLDLNKIKPSDLIDVQDTEFIWCTAVVKQVLSLNGEISLLIHYIGWNNVYDEIITADSQRLANYKFYTGRKKIARYQIFENVSQLQGYVVGTEQRNQSEQSDDVQEDEVYDGDQGQDVEEDGELEEADSDSLEEQMMEQQIQNEGLFSSRPLFDTSSDVIETADKHF